MKARACSFLTVAIACLCLAFTASAQEGPVITGPPQDQVAPPGATVVFTVIAQGTGVLFYQWLKDGFPIFGATASTLVLDNVTLNDAGVYSVVVTDGLGLMASAAATLTVTGQEPEGPVIMTQPESQTVPPGGTAIFIVFAQGTGALTYQWAKDGVGIFGATESTLVIENVTLIEAGTYTVVVTDETGQSVTSEPATLIVSSQEPGAPVITTQPQSQTVPPGGTATFTVFAQGTGALTYQWVKDGINIPDAIDSVLIIDNVTLIEAGTYTVVVTDETGQSVTSEPATLIVSSDPPGAPVITVQPQSQTVPLGGTVTFTVEADGTMPLLYQWSRAGVEIEGATQTSLILTDVTEADAGTYSVAVANDFGTVVSQQAVLTVGDIDPTGLRIAWVSLHPREDTPSAEAAAAGFTEAPDAGYTRLLAELGHTVTRVLSSGAPDVGFLNTFDLVMISRSVPSGDYQSAASTQAWNTELTVPTIIMGGYLLRDSRLGFTAGGTMPDTSGTVRLTVNDPVHPIFEGIALDTGNIMLNDYAGPVTFNEIPQRGISVNANEVAGGGTVLATIGTEGDNAFGGMVIGEWPAGAIMGNVTTNMLGGPRLVFLSGSREHGANPELGTPGLTAHGAGIYDLTTDGAQLLANAIHYMAEPRFLVHAPALAEDGLVLTWQGGTPPFRIQRKQALGDAEWIDVITLSERTATVPMDGPAGFIRIVSGETEDPLPANPVVP
jgi:hypothetical protein